VITTDDTDREYEIWKGKFHISDLPESDIILGLEIAETIISYRFVYSAYISDGGVSFPFAEDAPTFMPMNFCTRTEVFKFACIVRVRKYRGFVVEIMFISTCIRPETRHEL